MAHFYGDLVGNRGEVTRMGSKASGVRSHVRGWNFGIDAQMDIDENGEDRATIYLTSGSNGKRILKKLWMGTKADLENME